MRLHHLSLTAFGPFAGHEEVDFDDLCDAGLFLLTGPTGAGKTTVLDAVCFALYGSVPGVRGVKALKSQHAEPQARPEVVLEFSVRDRRFLIRRSPEWSRPKRRGDGRTTEHASATLVELTSGEDHLLSSRAQEVGHFVGELVGMQATQFVQVAMLPQGEFQRFLRASSQDRHDVLQHLFRTDRYARIEDWVHDHSRDLRERSAAHLQDVQRVLDTIADRAGHELPEELCGDRLQSTTGRRRAVSWADQLLEAAVATHTACADQQAGASATATRARTEHETAVAAHATRRRRDEALAALARLAHEADLEDAARQALAADARAAGCLPLVRLLDDALAERDRRAQDWATAAADLDGLDLDGAPLPDDLTVEILAERERDARADVARYEALLPRERELEAARAAATATMAELADTVAELTRLRERVAELPPRIEAARAAVAEAGESAARVDSLRLELDQARRRRDAALAAQRCAEELTALEDSERDARDRAADAREHVQSLTARRLAGIAAELAGRLQEGRACQVCGSTEHPDPATQTREPVTDAEQRVAAAAYDAATVALSAATGAVAGARERLTGLRDTAGGLSPEEAGAVVDAITLQLQEAECARAEREAAEERLQRLVADQAGLGDALGDLSVREATQRQTLASHRHTIHTAAAAIGDHEEQAGSLAGRLEAASRTAAALAEAREVLHLLRTACTQVDELTARAEEAVRGHDFADLAGVRSAVLDDAERDRLQDLLATRAEAAARARAVLEDDAVRALGDDAPPDLDAATTALAAAEESLGAASRAAHQSEEVALALGRLRGRLQAALAAWEPVLTEYLRAESMSKLVRGMGGDNQLQMRLSAYVLATRLDQVVAAANERLAHMRDQRYLLQRTGRAARKGAQAGLGLEVLDQWTGDVRDPTTLSGGETFVVSLALALGLADVVTQEAGGTEIETLFVDEGFGTLDADTLDDVMDRLDDLRAGGRAVGVVSHVSELRNRIPTQLHVEKRRTGSVVRVRTAVG